MQQTKVLAEEGQCGDDIDTGSIQWSEDENKERGNWKGRYDFLMSGKISSLLYHTAQFPIVGKFHVLGLYKIYFILHN